MRRCVEDFVFLIPCVSTDHPGHLVQACGTLFSDMVLQLAARMRNHHLGHCQGQPWPQATS